MRSSGSQLAQRALVLPARLPQVSRPTAQPTPDSKSQRAKAEAKEKAEARAARREDFYSRKFSDLWDREQQARVARCQVSVPADLDALSEAPSEEDPRARELIFCLVVT